MSRNFLLVNNVKIIMNSKHMKHLVLFKRAGETSFKPHRSIKRSFVSGAIKDISFVTKVTW